MQLAEARAGLGLLRVEMVDLLNVIRRIRIYIYIYIFNEYIYIYIFIYIYIYIIYIYITMPFIYNLAKNPKAETQNSFEPVEHEPPTSLDPFRSTQSHVLIPGSSSHGFSGKTYFCSLLADTLRASWESDTLVTIDPTPRRLDRLSELIRARDYPQEGFAQRKYLGEL